MQAILILAHKNIDQIVQLTDKLNDTFEVYIHIDLKTLLSDSDKEKLNSRSHTHWYQKYEVNWGAWSITMAVIFLMKKALKNPNVTFFHIISGQDWPACVPQNIYDFYENNIYMRYNKAAGTKKSGEPVELWQKYYFNYDKIKRKTTYGKIYHRASLLLQTVAHVNKFKQLHIDFDLYEGSQWMDLPRDVVIYLLSYLDSHKNVRRLFSTGFCSEEFWAQSILMNSKYRRNIVNDNHRYIVWKKKNGSYPAILDKSDFDLIRNGDYHFIRKVDMNVSKSLIDMLD